MLHDVVEHLPKEIVPMLELIGIACPDDCGISEEQRHQYLVRLSARLPSARRHFARLFRLLSNLRNKYNCGHTGGAEPAAAKHSIRPP